MAVFFGGEGGLVSWGFLRGFFFWLGGVGGVVLQVIPLVTLDQPV